MPYIIPQGNILGKRSIEDKHVLRDISNRVLPHTAVRIIYLNAIDTHLATLRHIQSQHDVHQRTLAGTRRAAYAEPLAVGYTQREIAYDGLLGPVVVTERHVAQLQRGVHVQTPLVTLDALILTHA